MSVTTSTLQRVLCTSLLALAAHLPAQAANWQYQSKCSWANPGSNKFKGDVAETLNSFILIPDESQSKIQARLRAGRAPDDVVRITRHVIESTTSTEARYSSAINYMHFGAKGSVCMSVDRSAWKADRVELADVWCERTQCVAVPRVCGNPSLIQRLARPTPAAQVYQPMPVRAKVAAVEQVVHEVPEPGTLALLLVGLSGILPVGRRRRPRA
jgi:PEP-CTERM motif